MPSELPTSARADDHRLGEAERLEHLWSGEFGDDYVVRNDGGYDGRRRFWEELHSRHSFNSAMEVGCNVGGNLQWIAPLLPAGGAVGIDLNHKALGLLRSRLPEVGSLWGPARELPFRDRLFDLVFTMGVLIHQPDSTLPLVMAEMVRCSDRLVLCGEYYADETTEVPYRGQEGALFRRDYGGLFAEMFPQLSLIDTGHLIEDEGWDNVTWWLFERT